MKLYKILLMLLIMMGLTGCVGEEPDNLAYITAIGIDKSEKNYVYTIQFANPTKISGGAAEEGGSGGNIVENIAVEAATIYSAVNSANSIISKDLSISHAKLFVISSDVAKEGISGINDVTLRNNDIRPDMYFAIADNAGNYLEEVKPSLELNPIKYYQLTFDNKRGGSLPHKTAIDFVKASVSGDMDCVLPLAGVAKADEEEAGTDAGTDKSVGEERSNENKSQSDAEMNNKGFENKTDNYYAGQAGKKIKNRSEALGMAIFKKDKYIDKLGSIDTKLYNIMMGTLTESNITFFAEHDSDKPITVHMEEKRLPKYNIDLNNKVVNVTINLECELISASLEQKNNNTIPETEEDMEDMTEYALVELVKKLYNEFKVDSFGICGKAKRKFITNNEYEKFKQSFNASEWKFEINPEIKMTRTGMTYYY